MLQALIDLLELGRRIRCPREIYGRSQEAFTDVCRLDRSYFGEIERGESNLTFNILSQICSGVNCDLASLTKGIPQIRNALFLNLPDPANSHSANWPRRCT